MSPAVDPLSSQYLADPYPFLAHQRGEKPVEYLPAIDMWIVTRFEDARQVFRDNKTFSAANVQAPLLPLCDEAMGILKDRFKLVPVMSNLDQPAHSRIRRKLARAFSARRIKLLTPIIEKRCRDLVGTFRHKGRIDIARELCYPLPAITIFTMFGFPDGDMDQIKEWCADKLVVNWGRPTEQHQIRAARTMVLFWEYCVDFVAKRRAAPMDDMTSDLIRDEDETQPLTDQEIASILFGLSFAGHETTTNQMTNFLRNLLENNLWQNLRENRDNMQSFIDESLRYDSSVIAWRRITTTEATINGVVLPKGAKVMIAIGGANRDPEHFPQPDDFDPARKNATDHLSFGTGIHLCLGRPLAHIEMAAMANVLLDGFADLQLVPDQNLNFPPNISFRGPESLMVQWVPDHNAG